MLTFGYEKIISHNKNFIYTSNHFYFKKLNEHLDIELKHIDEINCNYYYIVDMPVWNWADKTNLNNALISDKVLNDIKRKKCKLLFFYETANFKVKPYEKWIKKYNLPKNSIVIVTGNYSASKYFKDNKYITYFGYSIFEHMHYNDRKKELDLLQIESNLIDSIKQKDYREKVFLNYNRRIRKHKIRLVYRLYKLNLIDKGIVSLSNIVDDPGSKKEIKLYPKTFMDLLPIKVDNLDPLNDWDMAFDFNEYHYKNSFISITTESISLIDFIFPTEKIWKAIMGLHPFIIVSSPYFLDFLKSLGYKTFSKWIDESYDLEPDLDKRIEMVTDEIKKLTLKSQDELQNMLIEMLPTLIYNLNHLKRRSNNRELQTQLEKHIGEK